MPRAAKVDRNHAEIRNALRRELKPQGYVTLDTHTIGNGFPDLVAVSTRTGLVYLIEVKYPDAFELTPQEVELVIKLVSPSYRIAFTPEQIVQVLREMDDQNSRAEL